MPWKETSLVEERRKFIEDWLTSHTDVSGLCRVYGISRKIGYKWIGRFKMAGWPGLEERYPNVQLPAASTIGDILQRAGLITARNRRRRLVGQQGLVTPAQEANQVWSTDYKGQFRLGNGSYCYPLTVTDDFSRFVLGCDAHQRTTAQNARKSFEKLFDCYGLPDAMRSDNGTPFASVGAGRLTTLSAWWLKLGIRLDRITPGRPQENGRHERMHRTLKAETTRPPAASHAGQQRRFDTWRKQYNQERPHEALEQSTPTKFYCSFRRPYPKEVPPPEYPGHYEVRRVTHYGSWITFPPMSFKSVSPVTGATISKRVSLPPPRNFLGQVSGNISVRECSEGEKLCPTKRNTILGPGKEPGGRLSRPQNRRPAPAGAGGQRNARCRSSWSCCAEPIWRSPPVSIE
jgi:transposase InsO family protein